MKISNTHSGLYVYIVLAAVIVVAGAVLYVLYAAPEASDSGVTYEVDPNILQQRENIAALGAQVAYEKLERDTSGLTMNEQHVFAHAFGAALYQEEGLAGLSVCDDRFNYGCFHEFLGRAVSDRGTGILATLNRECINALPGESHFCQHGIGHGIQAHFGYSEENFHEALAACATLPDNDPIGGCSGGIFMEYNLRTMLAGEWAIRESDNPFAPCDSIDPNYLSSCHFWQPQWWYEFEVYTYPEKSKKDILTMMGERCHDMTKDQPKQATETCFWGIGNIFAHYSKEDTDTFCRYAADGDDLLYEKCYSIVDVYE